MEYVNNINGKVFDNEDDCLYNILEYLGIEVEWNPKNKFQQEALNLLKEEYIDEMEKE